MRTAIAFAILLMVLAGCISQQPVDDGESFVVEQDQLSDQDMDAVSDAIDQTILDENEFIEIGEMI